MVLVLTLEVSILTLLRKKDYQETHINMKPKILVTRKISDIAEKQLKEKFDVTLNLKDEPIPYENLAKTCNEYDGVIAASWDKFDSNFFNAMNGKLKIIASIAVGYIP